MPKKILYLQFRTDATKEMEQASVLEKLRQAGEEVVELHFISAFERKNELAFNNPSELLLPYQGLMLGGSSEYYLGGHPDNVLAERQEEMLRRIEPLMQHVIEKDFPTLGICFGHQLLAHFLGVRVLADPEQAETGTFPVRLLPEAARDPLFQGLPNAFHAFFAHRDSVECLPNECVKLASGERSLVGAFRYRRNIVGLQFHPELDKHGIPPRLALHPEYLSEGIDAFLATLQPTPLGRVVLANFIRTL